MKKYITLIIVLLVFATGCEDYLEPSPESLVTPENMKNPELLLRGAYQHLRSTNGSWKVSMVPLINTGNDEVIPNAFRGLSGQIWEMGTFGYRTSDQEISQVWTFLYGGVNATNHAILAAQKNENIQVEAEAKFLRGFYYYTLTTLFGGVPIIKSYEDDPYTDRSSLEDVLLFIEEDWKFAYENGPDVAVMPGRTTRLTAAGFLSKLYLYIGGGKKNGIDQAIEATAADPEVKKLVSFSNWSDSRTPEQYFQLAEEYANKVYGNFGLMGNYRDNFRKSGEDEARQKEWLFNIEAANLVVSGNQPEGFNFSKGFHMQNNKEFVPNYELSEMYIEEDTRIGNIGESPRNRDPKEEIGDHVFFKDNEPNPNGGLKKYIYTKYRQDLALGLGKKWFTSGLAILRYSDVILLLAESKYLNGDEASARELISEVRARATSTENATDEMVLQKMDSIYHKDDFMQELMDERKRELCAEGHRRVDLMRTGTLFSAINGLTEKDNRDREWKQGGPSVIAMKANLQEHPYRIWLPIPADQITVAGYRQNPGYPE